MKIKKNWSQFKEPQAPSTQSVSDRSLSGDTSGNATGNVPDNNNNTNNHDNIEVPPWLNDEELSDNELSDNESDEGSDNGSTDEESADNQMREKFLTEKLKEKGSNIPLPFRKKNNYTANNKTSQTTKSVQKSQIIQPKGLTDFLPGIFSDSSSLMAATVGEYAGHNEVVRALHEIGQAAKP